MEDTDGRFQVYQGDISAPREILGESTYLEGKAEGESSVSKSGYGLKAASGALLAVAQQAYVEGVSTRRVEELVQAPRLRGHRQGPGLPHLLGVGRRGRLLTAIVANPHVRQSHRRPSGVVAVMLLSPIIAVITFYALPSSGGKALTIAIVSTLTVVTRFTRSMM